MAAITPHVEEEELLDPLVAQYHDCHSGAGSQTGLAGVYGCPAPGDVLGVQHAGLANLQYNRAVALEALQGNSIQLIDSQDGYRLHLEKPIPYDALPWSLMANERSFKSVALLSWTSKMQTPSFSLPAGATELGGACPGAAAGQSVVDPSKRATQERRVLEVLNNYPGKGAEKAQGIALPSAVCEHCYATGGNYAYADIMLGALVRFAWTEYAVKQGFFADVMINAIARADYQDANQPAHWAATGWRFFRIHDSGDFYSKDYFRAWKKITDAFAPGNSEALGVRPVKFWAPTRMWAVSDWVEFIDRENGGERNLGNFVIRPSAYQLNQHAPELRKPGGGWGPASTVASPAVAEQINEGAIPAIYDWDCQAYAVAKGPNCRDACSPLGAAGCRACWQADAIVNYQAH